VTRRQTGADGAAIGVVLVIESAAVAVGALRYGLILAALGHEVSAAQAVALTVGGVLAAASGLFPGGLGMREVLVAGIAPLVGVSAAVGVVATAVDRLAGLAVLAVISAALVLAEPKVPPP
jgi:uncharacterized membrane protein YbhN (UPF0104 family)